MRRREWILLSAGALLLLSFLVLGFLWSWWFLPTRRAVDWNWRAQHSEKRVWTETQKSIRRFGWTHEEGLLSGKYGDRDFAARTITGLEPGDRMSCSGGHRGEALQYMTNQRVPLEAEAWLDWWEKNGQKTQEEWVREGFEQSGLRLHSPLTTEDVTALLKLIGEREKDEDGDGYANWKQPFYRRYNAFRWLRDSDFDPHSFELAKLAKVERDDADTVLAGLIEFSKKVGRLPKDRAPGVLVLGEPPYDGCSLAYINYPGFVTGVRVLLVLLLAAGCACVGFPLRGFLRRRRRAKGGADPREARPSEDA